MSGTFNPTALPDLPGVYTRYSAAPSTALPPSPGGIVAVPIVHDWGPANTLVFVPSFGEFENIFGEDDTVGRRAIFDAFRGEGLEGLGGASGVYVVRMAASTAAAGAVILKNPAKAAAVSIKARYKGTRGNRLQILAGPVVEGKQTITILDGTAELESFTIVLAESGSLQNLVSTINAVSLWVEASLTAEGSTGLEPATSPLTGGLDGSTGLTGTDWLSNANLLNNVDFAIFAPYDLPWEPGEPGVAVRATINSLKAWRAEQAKGGHRFEIVFGGALEEDPATAILRAQELNDSPVMTVGGPGVLDELFGKRSSSQLAPRYAGIRAQRGETENADFARLSGCVPLPKSSGAGVTLTEVESMVHAGVISLQRDRYAPAPCRIVKEVTTWAPAPRTPAEAEKPRAIYGRPKNVMSMQQFANEAEELLETTMIGKTVVNDATRAAAAARVLTLGQNRIKSGAFQAGFKVTPEPGSNSDEFIKLAIEIPFGRALAQLFLDATVS
jgi:hypothetical protein